MMYIFNAGSESVGNIYPRDIFPGITMIYMDDGDLYGVKIIIIINT